MNRTLTLATVALLVLALAAGALLISVTSDPADSSQSVSSESSAAPTESLAPTLASAQPPSQLLDQPPIEIPPQRPASLEGTTVPSGWNRTDANGALVPTPELRELFEYYLAALGEESLAQLVGRIQRALAALPQPARDEAVATLGAYLDYKLALGELEAGAPDATGLSPDAMARQMAEIHALRRQWLDAETADAFFAAEEAVDRFQLAQREIRADDSLTDEQRAARLREAEQSLPAPIRESRQETRKFAEYQRMRETLASDPEALQAWRLEQFGAEAAERLARVEADQRQWEQRWQAYQEDKAALEGLAGPERQAAIRQLREQHFEGPERIRAEALDSLR